MAKYRNGLATSYYRRREYAAAVGELTRAVRLDSLYAPARFNLGNALLRIGRREEGRRQLDLYRRLEEQERGISSLKNTLLTTPDQATVYHDLGMIYSRRGQYDQAQIHYMQAISRDTSFAPSYHNLGNIQLRQGRFEAALDLFRRALQADSTYVLSYLALGNVQMRLQQVPLALASYLYGLRFAPDDLRLQRNVALARRILATARQQEAR